MRGALKAQRRGFHPMKEKEVAVTVTPAVARYKTADVKPSIPRALDVAINAHRLIGPSMC
jgi:hypothetical protein